MTEVMLEIAICAVTAMILMIVHEVTKVLVYLLYRHQKGVVSISAWKLWRYIDPIGLILAIVCFAPVSRPYFYKIQSKRCNRLLGAAGLVVLLLCFGGSVIDLRCSYGGLTGLRTMEVAHWSQRVLPLFLQYTALLSLGMFCVNLFPVSVFDMGLLMAGGSGERYMQILAIDTKVKVIFILALLLGVIHWLCVRILGLLL